jgi:hypothetical protein
MVNSAFSPSRTVAKIGCSRICGRSDKRETPGKLPLIVGVAALTQPELREWREWPVRTRGKNFFANKRDLCVFLVHGENCGTHSRKPRKPRTNYAPQRAPTCSAPRRRSPSAIAAPSRPRLPENRHSRPSPSTRPALISLRSSVPSRSRLKSLQLHLSRLARWPPQYTAARRGGLAPKLHHERGR